MEVTTKPGAATEPDAAAAEQSAPAASSEREKQLEAQLKEAKRENGKLQKQVAALTSERDDYQAKYEEATKPATTLLGEGLAANQEPAAPAADPADPQAETKNLLKRHGLKKAWILPDGSTCFQEGHAKHVAGDKFNTLTVISAE